MRTGRYKPVSKIAWKEFRERYDREKLATLSPSSSNSAASAFNHLERVINPDRLSKLTSEAMSRFQAKLRDEGMRDTTIASHLRDLKAALRWAAAMGLMNEAPKIVMPRMGKGQTMMRGRPITGEEFERMLAVVPKVRSRDSAQWVRLITGLWLSGLRLEESLALSWDQDEPFFVDLTGKHPRFRIYSEAQKARRDETLPLTPDFAEWLLNNTPANQRTGQVFPMAELLTGGRMGGDTVGRVISRIGKKASVVVNRAEGKFASAHDLRRSFGTRWAQQTTPVVLQRLMRHSEITTTMRYYVNLSSDDLAEGLWAARKQPGNTSGNNGPQNAAEHNGGDRSNVLSGNE